MEIEKLFKDYNLSSNLADSVFDPTPSYKGQWDFKLNILVKNSKIKDDKEYDDSLKMLKENIKFENSKLNNAYINALEEKEKKLIDVINNGFESIYFDSAMDDYESYKDKNENAIETQMDTVIGITNATDPVILTLEIVKISFMFIFKLNRKTFEETLKKSQEFEGNITTEIFIKIMEILLTDNGSEFKSVSKIIEVFPDINIFYCHPYSSYEKGSIENNHELLRRVIPKSISLKPYSQTDYNKLASHINSLYRKKLKGKCPFELIEEYIPIEIINKLDLARVDDTKVNLTPYLLGTKNVENIKKYLTYEEMKEQNISLKRIEQEDNNE